MDSWKNYLDTNMYRQALQNNIYNNCEARKVPNKVKCEQEQEENLIRSLKSVQKVIDQSQTPNGANIYRSLIIQDFNKFVSEIKEFGMTTPYKEEISWGRRIEKKRQPIGSSWAYDIDVPAFGGYQDKAPDIEIKLYGKNYSVENINIEKSFSLNLENTNEREIRLKTESSLFLEKICITDIHAPEFLAENVKKGSCADINRTIVV